MAINIEKIVFESLRGQLNLNHQDMKRNRKTSFVVLGLDSLGLVGIILEIENQLKITLENPLPEDVLTTPETLINYVKKQYEREKILEQSASELIIPSGFDPFGIKILKMFEPKFNERSKTLIVSFAGLREHTFNRFFFEDAHLRYPGHWLYINDINGSGYTAGTLSSCNIGQPISEYLTQDFNHKEPSFIAITRFIETVLKKEGLTKVNFIGHSVGGFAALAVAAYTSVDRMLLFDPLYANNDHRGRRVSSSQYDHYEIGPFLDKIKTEIHIYSANNPCEERRIAYLKFYGLKASYNIVSGRNDERIPHAHAFPGLSGKNKKLFEEEFNWITS